MNSILLLSYLICCCHLCVHSAIVNVSILLTKPIAFTETDVTFIVQFNTTEENVLLITFPKEFTVPNDIQIRNIQGLSDNPVRYFFEYSKKKIFLFFFIWNQLKTKTQKKNKQNKRQFIWFIRSYGWLKPLNPLQTKKEIMEKSIDTAHAHKQKNNQKKKQWMIKTITEMDYFSFRPTVLVFVFPNVNL